MQVAVVPVQDIRIPDVAEKVAVRPDRHHVQRVQHVIELRNTGDDPQHPGIARQNRERERTLRLSFRRRGCACGSRHLLAPLPLSLRVPSTCPFFAPLRAEEEPGVRSGGASVAEQPLSVKRRSLGEPGDGNVSYETTFVTIMRYTPMRRAGDRTRRTTPRGRRRAVADYPRDKADRSFA